MSELPDDREALINSVDTADLERARAAVSKGVREAQDAWIPNHLIASALLLELRACISGDQPSDELARYLRQLADMVDGDGDNCGHDHH